MLGVLVTLGVVVAIGCMVATSEDEDRVDTMTRDIERRKRLRRTFRNGG